MANGAEVARAYVTIIPSMDGAQQSITESITGAAGSAGTAGGKQAGSSFSSALMGGLKTAGVAVAGLATAAVATGTKLFNLASGVAKTGDNIDKMSQKIGISTDAYQEWGYVFERCGANVNNLQTGMKTLSSVITDATNGSESAAQKLNAVGLSIEELNGLSQEQQLAKVIEALQGMGEGAERTAAATDLLGRSATDMGAVLNMTAGETQDLINEAHEYGMVMSNEAVKNSAAFQDSLTRLQHTAGGLKNAMVGELLPGITQVMDGLSELMIGADGAAEHIQEGAMNVINAITGLIPQLSTLLVTMASTIMQSAPMILQSLVQGIIDALPILIPAAVSMISQMTSTIVQMLPELVNAALQIIMALALGLAEAIPAMIPQIVEVVMAIQQTLIDNAPLLLDSAMVLIMSLIEGIIDNLPMILDAMPTLITSVCNGITNNLPRIIEMGLQLIVALANGLIKAIPQLVKSIPQIISAMVNAFSGMMSQVMNIGRNLVQGIWSGISSAASWLYQQIKQWANNLISSIKGFFGIHSPSKLTESMGQFLSMGLALGMEDKMDVVEGAASDLRDAISGELGGMENTLATSASVDASMYDNRGSSDVSLLLSALGRIQTAIESKNLTLDGRQVAETVTKYQRQTARAFG